MKTVEEPSFELDGSLKEVRPKSSQLVVRDVLLQTESE
jgi:hypothetical protein